MEPTQTALIVPVPQAEGMVGRFRASLDRAAFWDRHPEAAGQDAPSSHPPTG